ncbi:Alpha-mannosyltransferase [Phytophthora cactorum]|nr:Alpha-mannosyltransferase [Phytophthora cactorum]
MMVDADTGFFVSPTVLWESEKYTTTGTLLMNDRIAHEIYFMAERVGYPANPAPVKLKFEPSDYLLNSHSWNLRTGHQVDSSIMFWNKKKQPRATAILGSFKSLSDIGSPPSYGDKELYFYAAELAETQYSFSDHAIGAVGTDYRDYGEKNSTLCGDMAQVFPIKQANEDDVPLFYLNSDRVLHFKPEVEPVYYMKARMADVYLGAFGERRMECPFEMTGAQFSDAKQGTSQVASGCMIL